MHFSPPPGGILDKVDDSNSGLMILKLIYELLWTDRTAQCVLGLLVSCMLLPLVLQFTGGGAATMKTKKKENKVQEKTN